MKRRVTMREALEDPALLGKAMPGDSWAAWRALIVAIMGEPLTVDERAIFTELTGRDVEPLEMVEEAWLIIGRRGGKTRGAAVIAVYIAALCDHTDKLAEGERAALPIIATTTRQARKAFSYACSIIDGSPLLSDLVSNRTADSLSLLTRVDIEIQPASWRGNRGDTAVAVIADEIAFFRSDDAANPDTEILNALRPAPATTGGPIVAITSPYARRGEVYTTHRRHYGQDGDPLILVAQAPSRTMNPALSQKVVDRALERDPAAAAAEYLAQFRTDVEVLLTREVVEAAIEPGRIARPYHVGKGYVAFVDPSGGTNDSMTLAIAHRESDQVILDLVLEWKAPFSPEAVVAEFSEALRRYRLSSVTGDRYAGEWPRERFRVHGIDYRLAEANRSELYLALVPLLNSGLVSLLDNERLVNQLVNLERRTTRGGRDLIDHPPGGHDDIANSVAGAFWSAGIKQHKSPAPSIGRPYGFR